MEMQKIVNLLKSSENEYSKFATKVDTESKRGYLHEDRIKFVNLCDYSDAYFSYRKYCCYKNYCCYRR